MWPDEKWVTTKAHSAQLSWVESGRQSVQSARSDSTQPVELSLVESGILNANLTTSDLWPWKLFSAMPTHMMNICGAVLEGVGQFGAKFQVAGGRAPPTSPTNHSSCRKTRIIDLSYDIKYGQIFFRFMTVHAFDKWTDRRTDKQTDCPRLSSLLSIHRPHQPRRGVRTAIKCVPDTRGSVVFVGEALLP